MGWAERKSLSPGTIAIRALLFAVGYFGCAELGNLIASRPGSVVAFWPPSGYFAAVLLAADPRLWPFLAAAALPANAVFDLLRGREPLAGLLFYLSHALAASAGAFLVRRLLGGKPRLTALKPTLVFLGVSGLLATVLSATAGSAIYAVRSGVRSLLPQWAGLWTADMLGVFVVAPAVLAWIPRANRRRGRSRAAETVESAAAVAGLSLVAAAVFGTPAGKAMDLEFLALPFLFWSAMRLDIRVSTLMNLLLSLVVVFCTTRGLGPFAAVENPAALRSLIMQGFLSISCATAVILAALLEELRSAMERLRAQEADLAMAQQIAGLGSWSFDLAKENVSWSRQMHVIHGTDPDRYRPGRGDMERYFDPEDRPAFLALLRKAISEGGGFSRELRIRRSDGSVRTVLVRGECRKGSDGRPARLVGTEQDITDRKRSEEERRAHQRQLIQADKMASLGVLASGVAHEINNPVHTIKLNMQIISDVWASLLPLLDSYYDGNGDFLTGGIPYSQTRTEMPAILSGIAEAAGHIESIVGDLKSYTRMDETPIMMEMNLNLAVKAAATLAGSFIAKATSRFRLDLAESLPSIRGNIHRLEQVVINLLQNACQALDSPEQGILVRTHADADGRTVTLSVADEGRGMDAEELSRIKEPFFTTKRSSGGTGLGLSVSDAIVEEHGGSLSYESLPGRGTTATVRFPAAREPPAGGTA